MHLIKSFFVVLLIFGCNSKFKENPINKSDQNEIMYVKSIENNWIEINFIKNKWTYLIPCFNQRETQKITLSKIHNFNAITWNSGLESQWYIIKKTIKSADSVTYKTVLPFDSLQEVIFSFRYINKEKTIAKWGVDGYYKTFIPAKDTITFTKKIEECN